MFQEHKVERCITYPTIADDKLYVMFEDQEKSLVIQGLEYE